MIRRIIDQVWHRIRGYEYVNADQVNAETGTMDFYCACRLCRKNRDRI